MQRTLIMQISSKLMLSVSDRKQIQTSREMKMIVATQDKTAMLS